jgi:uncharacterized membrane protein
LILRTLCRYLLAALFLFAGAVHLYRPEIFLPIMPPEIPFPVACILISGVAEFLGGIGLLFPEGRIRTAAGWWLLALLIAVFPANIYMAAVNVKIPGLKIEPWMAWARLPLQPLLMVMVAWVSGAWTGICRKGASMKFKPPAA